MKKIMAIAILVVLIVGLTIPVMAKNNRGKKHMFRGDTFFKGGPEEVDDTGLTDDCSYWLCTDENCEETCQVIVEDGLIVNCEREHIEPEET